MKKISLNKIFFFIVTAVLSAFLLVGCALIGKPNGPTDPCANGHKYSDEWMFDENGHWHESVCEHTGLRTQTESHNFIKDGVIVSDCTVCGYTRVGFGMSFTMSKDGTTCSVKKNASTELLTELVIPSEYQGATVTAIDNFGFEDLPALERVVIPDTVLSIGRFAFSDCTALKDVNIPSGIKEIQSHTFERCSSLSSIELPETVTAIDEYAFNACSAFTGFVLPASVKNIWANAFNACYRLAEVYNLTDLNIVCGSDAFGGVAKYARVVHGSLDEPSRISRVDDFTCYSDDTTAALLYYHGDDPILELPQKLDGKSYDIGVRAFRENNNITCVKISGGVGVIESEAFLDCKELVSVSLDGVTEICDSAFSGCQKLSGLTLPDTLEKIGEYAFMSCRGITELNVPSGVSSIGDGAFYGCSKLERLTVPFVGNEKNTDGKYDYDRVFGVIFGYQVNERATGAGVIQYTRKLWNKTEYYSYWIPDSLRSVTVTGECTIPENAFTRCDMIEEFCAPNSEILSGAFTECGGMTSLGIRLTAHVGTLFGIEQYYGSKAVSANGKTYYVPSSLVSVRVCGKSVPNYAFANMTGLTSIELVDGIVSIGISALSGCTDIESIDIPSTVVNVGYSAFYGCTGLTEIDISNVTAVQSSVFEGCTALTSVGLSDEITMVAGRAFYGCESLSELSVDGVTSVGDEAFYGCKSLDINMPRGLTSIGRYAFMGCAALKTVDIPNTVTSIGDGAFNGCASVAGITLPFLGANINNHTIRFPYPLGYIFGSTPYDGGIATKQNYSDLSTHTYYIPSALKTVTVTGGELGFGAFSGCAGLTAVTLPNTVDRAPDYAFYGCSALRSLGGYDSFAHIGARAFYDCGNLGSLHVASDISHIGDYAFSGCDGLDFYEYENGLYIGDEQANYTVLYGVKDKSVTTFAINPATKYLVEYAISDCANLSSLGAVPSGVAYLKAYTISNCPSLSALVIPDTVERIECGAFYGCGGLTSITLPYIGESLTVEYAALGHVFGKNRYAGAAEVQQTYKNGVLSTETFYIPTGLSSVTVNGGAVGKGAFQNCTMLISVNLPSGIVSIGDSAFSGCSGISSLTLPDTVKTIGNSAFADCGNLSSLDGLDGVTSIGYFAFKATAFTEFAMPVGVENVASWLFDSCTSLETVDLGNVTEIRSGAFSGCIKLKEIEIPEAVAVIEEQCFKGCKALESVTFAQNSNITTFAQEAFYGCSKLSNFAFPQTTQYIGSQAFYGCYKLSFVTLGANTVSIGDSAFRGCSGLTEITLPFTGASRTETETYKRVFGFIFGYTTGTRQSDCPSNATYQCVSSNRSIYYFFYIPASIKSVHFTGEVVSDDAFYNCGDLTAVDFGSGVTEIGSDAFGVCIGLTEITIPSSVTAIGSYAFTGCANLAAVRFENTVGWYCTSDKTATSGTSVTVTNTANNAKWLNGTLEQRHKLWWKRS